PPPPRQPPSGPSFPGLAALPSAVPFRFPGPTRVVELPLDGYRSTPVLRGAQPEFKPFSQLFSPTEFSTAWDGEFEEISHPCGQNLWRFLYLRPSPGGVSALGVSACAKRPSISL